MNQLNKILLQTHNATGHPLRKIAPLALVAMVVGVALFIAYGLAGTAHVQAESGAIPSLTLDSNEPGQLVINWQAPDPAPTDYRLSWANTSLEFLSYKDSNEAQRGNVYPAGGVITLTLTNLTPGDTYKVQMRSRYYNEDGSGRQSSGPWTPITTQRVKNHPPAAPTSLTISEVAHDSLILSWDDPQDANITGYRIQRGTDADSLHSIEANTESASTNYTDSTVEPETTYHYAVLALSQDGNGARSITSVTTPAEPEETVQNDPPAAPTGLTAARVGHSVLALTWDDPQDANITGYRVLRGAEADNLSVINSDTASSTTEYEDDTVAPDTTYYYAVTALSANGDGAQSTALSATTTEAPDSKDPPPQRVGARQSTPQVLVSNIGQGPPVNRLFNTAIYAQQFTTGTNPTGYTLSAIDLGLTTVTSETGFPTVKVYSGSGNGTEVTTLTPPSSVSTEVTNYTYTAPANVTLAKNTDYWVVAECDCSAHWTYVGTGDDSNPAPGWSIADQYEALGNRPFTSTGRAHAIRVRGTSNALPIMVSNVGQDGADFNIELTRDLAQRFTTGNNLTSYTLYAIDLRLTIPTGSVLPTVKLYTGSGNGTLVASLTPPSSTSTSETNYTYTAPANVTLAKNTNYWVVAECNCATTWSIVSINQDANPAPGWSIADQAKGRIESSPYSFITIVARRALAISVKGTINPIPTLVSNVQQGSDSNANFTADHGQAFTTGSTADVFIVADVSIRSEDSESDDIELKICEVDTKTHPTTVCTVLDQPSTFNSGTLIFTSPTRTPLTLSSGTTYMVVFHSPGGQNVVVDATTSDGEDSASLTGWSIRNLFHWNNAGTWQNSNSSKALRIAINGILSTDNAPTVQNMIPDQSATTGTAFSYAFPDTTFADSDSDSLTYMATKADGTALPNWLAFAADTRTFSGTPQVADAGTVSVKVTANDGRGGSVTDTFHITVNATVPADWSLKPTGLTVGDHFRLLFLSSTKRNGSSTAIAVYNTFIQVTAAAGHADIQAHSAGFRVVGCTEAVDARDNTSTTYTSTAKGVPIYWLNGTKVADQYEDFYDGSWDDEANPKNESGTEGLNPTINNNLPITGCEHNGTEAFSSISNSFALGSSNGIVVGRPTFRSSGPLSSTDAVLPSNIRPIYGLSTVFHVVAANNPPTVENMIPDQSATPDTAFSYAFPDTTFADADSDSLTYMATKADGTALPNWLAFAVDTRTFSGTPQTADAGTVSVKVTANDGRGGSVSDTFDITVAVNQSTPQALVNNIGQVSSLTTELTDDLAQQFTTGSNFTGYTLTTIDLRLTIPTGSALPTVKLYAGSASGTQVASLTTPSSTSTSTANYTYTAPANVTLAKNTNYWVVAECSCAATWSVVSIHEDPTPAPGWSIADQNESRAGNALTPYVAHANLAFTIRVNGTINPITDVPADWSLKPTGLTIGDHFRLLFLSSTRRNGSSTAIADYNTFIQASAAAGHADIQAHSAGFRVVGCTEAVDARDNTSTTYTSTAKGVPIYWLNGTKVADQYEDFYDGSWDDEANPQNQSGTEGLNPGIINNLPITGCEHNGTEAFSSISNSFALGSSNGIVVGRPTFSTSGPLSSTDAVISSNIRPMYGLSTVFHVVAANNPPTVENMIPDQSATPDTAFSYAFPDTTFADADSDSLTYMATKADDTALPNWLAFAADTRTFSGTPQAADAGTVSVKVTASDGNGGSVSDEFNITVRDPNAGICPRTAAVQTAILDKIPGVTDCAVVTNEQLAAITGSLDLARASVDTLAAGDFDGLTSLTHLYLENNRLAALPAGVFNDLNSLVVLSLHINNLTQLPSGIFAGLSTLVELNMEQNRLSELSANVFEPLTSAKALILNDNLLTALPDGVFRGVTSQTSLHLARNPGAPFKPMAVAKPDDGRVSTDGDTITLDGSTSDGGPWGDNVTYAWTLTSPASGATFDDAASTTPTVTITPLAADTELTFTLTVRGNHKSNSTGVVTATDTAKVTVIPQHCLTNTDRLLWCATLTVGSATSTVGFDNSYGRILPSTFTYRSATIQATSLGHPSDSSGSLEFSIALSSCATHADGLLGSKFFTLEIGTGADRKSFAIDNPGTTTDFTFPDHGQNWSVGDKVQVKLIGPLSRSAPWGVVLDTPPGTTGIMRARWQKPLSTTGVQAYHLRYNVASGKQLPRFRRVNTDQLEYIERYLPNEPGTTNETRICTVTRIDPRDPFWDTLGDCSPWSRVEIPERNETNANDISLSLELADGSSKVTIEHGYKLDYRVRINGLRDTSVLPIETSTVGSMQVRLKQPGSRGTLYTGFNRGAARKFIVWDGPNTGYINLSTNIFTPGIDTTDALALELVREGSNADGVPIGEPGSICIEVMQGETMLNLPCPAE